MSSGSIHDLVVHSPQVYTFVLSNPIDGVVFVNLPPDIAFNDAGVLQTSHTPAVQYRLALTHTLTHNDALRLAMQGPLSLRRHAMTRHHQPCCSPLHRRH